MERLRDRTGAHPVGTGPFVLKEWRPLLAHRPREEPDFREEYFEAEPPADDPVSQRLHREMSGKRIPQLDRVEIYVIEESQPRWLAFLNGELDWVNLPYEFNSMAIPRGQPAPWLAKKGVKFIPSVDLDLTYMYWNMKDPVWGGYSPERIALRRAISLAYDMGEEIFLVRNGTAVEAATALPPGVLGHDPAFHHGTVLRSGASQGAPGHVRLRRPRRRRLARTAPTAARSSFHYATSPAQLDRLFTQLWKKNLDAVGVRMEVEVAKWPDLRKKSKLGQLPAWHLAWNADFPDGENFYQLLYGPIAARPTTAASSSKPSTASTTRPRAFPPAPSASASTGRWPAWSPSTRRGRPSSIACATSSSSRGCWAGASTSSSTTPTATSTSTST